MFLDVAAGTILTGLLSFMVDPQPTTGSIVTTAADKKRFAADSLAFNMKNPTFRKLFPNWVEIAESAALQQPQSQQQQQGQAGTQQQGAGHPAQPAGAGPAAEGEHANGGPAHAAGANGAAAGAGQHNPTQQGGGQGSSALTIAIVVVLLAMAVAPFLSIRAGLRLPGS